MKKIIILSILSLMSSVYAGEFPIPEKPPEMVIPQVKVQAQTQTQTEINKSFLYEFDFTSVGQEDTSIHKYITNNTDSVASVAGLKDVMINNWGLGKEYTKNIKLKTENKVLDQLVCKYNNGLVIKVKAYGDYSTVCPLKS